ncbi:MAG TPA: OmpA family protein [Puia sp.]|jgi:chemotaxis protein MotB|nr:OmpA family protein [Puia sp.]
MSLRQVLVFVLCSLMLFSCVSTKKFKALQAKDQARFDSLSAEYGKLQSALKSCNDGSADVSKQKAALQAQLDDLNKQMSYLKDNNTQTLKQLQDMSVISSAQAESIKKSLDNIGAKDAYITDLQAAMARKDSLNMALVMNLKGAIGNMADSDVNIKVDKGVIFIDISDKLLFHSGSFDVTKPAKAVLAKVAQVLKTQPDIEFMVEGNTDNVELHNKGIMIDNWDLSVKRATSVIRILQKQYGIPPSHMTAAGRSEYVPVATNDTKEGRAANRRTRIVILPQLDQFFNLLEKKS